MIRRALGAAGGGGILSTLLTAGWAGAVLLIGVVVVLVGAVCWVIADQDRPARLALLITNWRTRTPPRGTSPARPRTRSPAPHQPASDASGKTPGLNP